MKQPLPHVFIFLVFSLIVSTIVNGQVVRLSVTKVQVEAKKNGKAEPLIEMNREFLIVHNDSINKIIVHKEDGSGYTEYDIFKTFPQKKLNNNKVEYSYNTVDKKGDTCVFTFTKSIEADKIVGATCIIGETVIRYTVSQIL